MIRTTDGHVVRALTIAGSDSGGGAGIQADIKTMQQFQVFGMSVITALTAQNTTGVQGIYEVSSSFVRLQLESVFSDIGVDAIKTGMLSNADIIRTVARCIKEKKVTNVVVDPVMVAKGGTPLIVEEAVQSMVDELLPLSTVVTPNVPEAEVLCGYPIRSWADCHRAARDIAALGPKTVVIKGGHMPSDWYIGDGFAESRADSHAETFAGGDRSEAEAPDFATGHVGTITAGLPKSLHADVGAGLAVDLVYADGQFTYFATERVETHKTHGTGCTFSAAVTSKLATGTPVLAAIAAAKGFIYAAVRSARDWDVGSGHGPTDHSASLPQSFQPETGHFYLYHGDEWSLLRA